MKKRNKRKTGRNETAGADGLHPGQKRVGVAGGQACPKCGEAMQRYEHAPDWRPKAGRGYFKFWDRCKSCGWLQYYEDARVSKNGSPPQRNAAHGKNENRVPTSGGKACPKCGKVMQRYEHPASWRPPAGRGHFRFWDFCQECGHVQHYKAAWVPPRHEEGAP